jgi:hypothetical protein
MTHSVSQTLESHPQFSSRRVSQGRQGLKTALYEISKPVNVAIQLPAADLREEGPLLSNGTRKLLEQISRPQQATARRNLEEHQPQREQVRTTVQLPSLDLLGGHVLRSSHHGSLFIGIISPGIGPGLSDAKVRNLDLAIPRDQDVGGL